MARGVVSVLVFTAIFFSGTHTTLRMQGVPAAHYAIRDLGTFGGSLTSALATTSFAIGGTSDDLARVVGYSRTLSNANHAFVYHQGQLRDLGTLGGTTSVARSVNTFEGHVVGESRNRSGVNRAFLYANGSMQDLGAHYATGQSFARSINDNGEIVGGTQTTANVDSTRAFIHRNGAMSLLDLSPTFGGTKSVANAINEAGQIVGSAYITGNASYRAFLYEGGATDDLGTLGGSNSEATALNAHGHVVGRSQIAGSSRQHAFLYKDGSLQDLGTLGGANSEALAINYHGDVVGTSQIAGSSTYHAFIWRNGRMTNLNTLLPPDSGWVLERANGISHGGQIVGRGRFAGQTRAFVMLPPLDVAVSNFGYNDQTGNFPNPVQAGRTLSWVLFVTNQSDGGGSATNVTVTDTLSGPVEYVSIGGDSSDGCQILGRTLECHFDRIEDGSFGEYVSIAVRPTAAGEFGHTVRITHADQGDPNPSNNQYSESNLAISLANLTLNPTTVAGGKSVGVNVTLTSPHPHGATVRMTSSNPSVAPVPPTFVHVFDQTRTFHIVPAVVSAPTTVQISATYGLVTRTATLTVLPPALSALQLTPTTVVGGCGTVGARVSLTGNAPGSGAAVAINEALAAARFPTSLVVPAGAIIHTFTIPTNWVTATQSGPVTATYGGASRAVTLTVRPVRARSIALTPNAVRGGGAVTGVVTLECAPPTSVVVSLSSGNSTVASPTVSSITIPAGQLSASFQLRTSPVLAPTAVPIYTRIYGVRQTATLTVNP